MPRALLGLALYLAFASYALAGEPLNLDQARQIAVQNHPEMQAAELAKLAAGEQVTIARSDFFPQISGDALATFPDGSFTRLGAPPGGINNPSIVEHASVGLGVQQMVTDFGRTRDLVAAARYELEAQRGHSAFARDSVLVNVTRAYFELLRAQALEVVANDALKTRQTLLNQISELRKAQLKSDLDVSVAEQLVADARLFQLKAKNAVNDSSAILAASLGLSRGGTFVLSDDAEMFPPPGDFDRLMREATAYNPQLAMAAAERDAAMKRTDAAGKAWYPTVNVVGFAGLTPFSESDQEIPSKYAAAGVTVSVPLFTGGRLAAEQRQAGDVEGIAQADLKAKLDLLMQDLRVAYDNAETAYENIQVTEDALKNADKTLSLMQASYNLGRNSIVDLSQAQLAETQAAIAKSDATYGYLIEYALLRFALGNDHIRWERNNVLASN